MYVCLLTYVVHITIHHHMYEVCDVYVGTYLLHRYIITRT